MAFADKKQASKYVNEFAREKYDRIAVNVPKGERDRIKAAADAAGESLTSYIVNAVRARMAAEEE